MELYFDCVIKFTPLTVLDFYFNLYGPLKQIYVFCSYVGDVTDHIPEKTRLVPEKRHVCMTCGKKYSRPNGLLQHQKYQCGKEPQFKCPIEGCGHRAHLKFNLKSHMNAYHFKKMYHNTTRMSFDL
nr:unnamed protein product [Callosobruchus analis]